MSIDVSAFSWYSVTAFIPLVVVCVTASKRDHLKRDIFFTAILSLLLFLSASGLISFGGSAGTCRLFLIDESGSASPYRQDIDSAFRSQLTAAEQEGSGGDMAALILFGETADVAVPPCGIGRFSKRALNREAKVSRNGTDLEGAVQAALAAVPHGYTPELTVIGDGTHQSGPVRIPAGIQHTYIAVSGKGNDAAVLSLAFPETVEEEEQFSIELEVYARHTVSSIIRIYTGREGAIRTTMPARLEPGINRFDIPLSFRDPGLKTVMAEIEIPDDIYPDNNVLKRAVNVRDGSSAPVLVAGNPPENMPGTWDRVSASQFRTMSEKKIGTYGCILISNVPYKDIGPDKDAVLRNYVLETGGGLMITGTDSVFGPGGYGYTPLEKILPLSSKPRTPGTSPKRIMIAVDKSGSMNEPLGTGKGRRIDSAKAAALQFILEHEEEKNTGIGLLLFSADVQVVKRPSETKPYSLLTQKLKSLTPFGGTKIISALERCAEILGRESVSDDEDVYIFVITDGITREEISQEEIKDISSRLKGKGYVLFVLKIGTGTSVQDRGDVLRDICSEAGGKYSQMIRHENLVLKFLREADSETTEYFSEKACAGVFAPGATAVGISGEDKDFACRGYIRTSLQNQSILIAKNSSNDDPFAAVRYSGLGRTAAVSGLRSEKTPDIVGTLLAWARGRTGAGLYSLEIRSRGSAFRMRLFSKHEIEAGTDVRVRIAAADGTAADVRMIRDQVKEFYGEYGPSAAPEWFAYTVFLDRDPVLSGRHYSQYSSEYHPLYTRPVLFSESAARPSRSDGSRSYVPFIIAFIALFTVYEAVKGIDRMKQENHT